MPCTTIARSRVNEPPSNPGRFSSGLEGLSDAYPDELSQGEQQRIAIARAAIVDPIVLIADEPTSSQDEESARQILDRLVEPARTGTACLVASHDPIISEYATRIITIRDGTIQASPS